VSRRFFLSYVRLGAGGGIIDPDPLTGPIPRPPEIRPQILLTRDGAPLPPIEGPAIRLMDPDDVQGISDHAVVRRYPESGSATGAPNELAYIEFARPDLPWMFTPASATPERRLRPWIVLVVVPLGTEITHERPVPRLRVAASELPDLAESNLWAHAQVMADGAAEDDIEAAISRGGPGAVSRLVCPRKLEEGSAYRACVVPAFDATLRPSWRVEDGGTVQVPIYLSWTFRTGPKEDFEDLVLRLRPIESTAGLGTRVVDASRPWPTWKTLRELAGRPDDATPALFQMDGALAVPGQESRPSLDDACKTTFRKRVAEHLNHPALLDDAGDRPPDDPRENSPGEGTSLAPPIYGGHHAKVDTVAGESPEWVDDLNLEPRRRAAAAMGTRYVQEHQEFLMARAWEQLRDIEKANQLRRIAELASVAGDAVHRRTVAALTPAEALGLAAPARTRIRRGGQTLQAEVKQAKLPAAVATPAFRRLVRPKGPIARRVLSGERSVLVERAMQGDLAVLPPPTTAAAPIVSIMKPAQPARGGSDATSRLAAAHRSLFAATEERALAEGLSAAQKAVDVAETASAGGMAFPAALEPVRDRIRSDLGAWDLRVASVASLRTLLDDPDQVRIAADVVGGLSAFVNNRALQPAAAAERPGTTLDPDDVRSGLIAALRPSRSLRRRLADRMQVPLPGVPDGLGEIMAHPEFPAPLAMALLQKWPETILPGLGAFPMNRVALLETNPAFIEAFLVGVNHEMNREFLWREFPTDQRGTPFKHFWPRPAAGGRDGREIEPIVRWTAGRPLGGNLAGGRGAETVLLVRGEVLRRFPNTIVMAAPALDIQGAVAPFEQWRLPTFPVPLGNDSMAYVFDLDPDAALGSPGWFFVFVEPTSVPRYGFDVTPAATVQSWNDMAWADVRLSRERFVDIRENPARLPVDRRGVTWGVDATAADVATATLQRPFRLLFHAKALFNV
jgi:hypothetical protein